MIVNNRDVLYRCDHSRDSLLIRRQANPVEDSSGAYRQLGQRNAALLISKKPKIFSDFPCPVQFPQMFSELTGKFDSAYDGLHGCGKRESCFKGGMANDVRGCILRYFVILLLETRQSNYHAGLAYR